MKLSKILKNIKYTGKHDDREIANITYDSRKVEKGSCFVAIKGHAADGNEYIQSAINNGASLAITDQSNKNFEVPLIKVSNARKALSRISSNLYENPSENINAVGITGTNGKTTVAHIIKTILKEGFEKKCATIGTLGFYDNNAIQTIVIGAHYDHLGYGHTGSLSEKKDQDKINQIIKTIQSID